MGTMFHALASQPILGLHANATRHLQDQSILDFDIQNGWLYFNLELVLSRSKQSLNLFAFLFYPDGDCGPHRH